MPELPEVETIRADLAPLLEGRRIVAVRADLGDRRHVGLEGAIGRKLVRLGRRGKYLLADLGDRELIIHLGMTGQLAVMSEPPPAMRHLRATFALDDGMALYFNDQRRFGRLVVGRPGMHDALPTLSDMGPEPLGPDFELAAFAREVARGRAIKPLLLGQRVVAGLGNIYVDEALHLARLHPARTTLSPDEATRLHAAIVAVLAHGVEHRGTTFKDYRDGMGHYGGNQDFLRVYDREHQPCTTCQAPIVKVRLGGRGTYFCPLCQPAGERSQGVARNRAGNRA